MNDFADLMQTIRFLGDRPNPNKEERLTYLELLRYAGSLARLNTQAVDGEILRRDGRDSYNGRPEGNSVNRT